MLFNANTIGIFVLLILLPAYAQAQSAKPTPIEDIAKRVQAMEEANRQLELSNKTNLEQLRLLREQYDDLSRRVNGGTSLSSALDETAPPGSVVESPIPDYTEGSFRPYEAAPGLPGSNLFAGSRFPLKASFGPGFLLQSENKEFSLQVHYESQVEYRHWTQDQLPANDGFFLPRQRFFFNGTVSKNVEYEIAINRGVNNINLLNAYLNFHFNDNFELKIGRFFTPLTYEQYAVSNYWLLTPERSVFTTNLSLNRQVGAMAWGYLFDKHVDYAVGAFNGSRNSFESLNNSIDVVSYLNARPFQSSETLPFLKNWNIGSSVAFGTQDQSPVPVTFRIGGGSPDANIPGPATTPFLILNNDVRENGDRVVGSVHSAYFYKSLSLMGEWQYGYGNYTSNAQQDPVQVPYSGYYFASGYFLTGEEIQRRTRVKPLRPLIKVMPDDELGCGAWELTGRVSKLELGEQVFSAGFANANTWSNSVVTSELGVNWYLNEYLKVYMCWMHADFGDPVQFRPGEFQKSTDLMWLRCQFYF